MSENITLQEAVDYFKDYGVHNKDADICRFFSGGPFIKGAFIRDAHKNLAIKMGMVSREIDTISPLEKFAIKVIILHLEELLEAKYDAKEGVFIPK